VCVCVTQFIAQCTTIKLCQSSGSVVIHYVNSMLTVAMFSMISNKCIGVLSGNSETAGIGLLADEDATTVLSSSLFGMHHVSA